MKLEEQVCSLELAKELKELGVKQESLWYWIKPDKKYNNGNEFWDILLRSKNNYVGYTDRYCPIVERYSAFTVAELGKMLPEKYCSFYEENNYICVELEASEDEWWLDYRIVGGSNDQYKKDKENEANARAKMLIYLLEDDVIKVEDKNESI